MHSTNTGPYSAKKRTNFVILLTSFRSRSFPVVAGEVVVAVDDGIKEFVVAAVGGIKEFVAVDDGIE